MLYAVGCVSLPPTGTSYRYKYHKDHVRSTGTCTVRGTAIALQFLAGANSGRGFKFLFHYNQLPKVEMWNNGLKQQISSENDRRVTQVLVHVYRVFVFSTGTCTPYVVPFSS